MSESDLETRIVERLDRVYDRCSCYTGDPVSVVEMGMVEDLDIDPDAGTVEVTLLVTSPMCTFFLDMSDEIKDRVANLPEIETVSVVQDTSGQVWTQQRMSEEARTRRRERMVERMESAGITPYAEQT